MALITALVYDGPNEGAREVQLEIDDTRWLNEWVPPYLATCQRCGGECCNCGACVKAKGSNTLCFRCAAVPLPRVPPKEKVRG